MLMVARAVFTARVIFTAYAIYPCCRDILVR